ncbi:hypothetical protein CROQUDRAFT_467543 [Cronartium quercuum f. sp. fusiforme G11]|uniref:Secreted mucin n=1 Tax=Cronartium quercuum f. sp. fusiforme G11 TaxID=708437 RepID=A0A9P6NWW3_9BASI|nr:hypothetical protein CROQUDRAFT_467543 [Cronartium quercuum f. sp. fusiforme G11]
MNSLGSFIMGAFLLLALVQLGESSPALSASCACKHCPTAAVVEEFKEGAPTLKSHPSSFGLNQLDLGAEKSDVTINLGEEKGVLQSEPTSETPLAATETETLEAPSKTGVNSVSADGAVEGDSQSVSPAEPTTAGGEGEENSAKPTPGGGEEEANPVSSAESANAAGTVDVKSTETTV